MPRGKTALQHFSQVTPMGRPTPHTQAKRRREQIKREKRDAKAEKKALQKAQKDLEEAGVEDGGPEPLPNQTKEE